MDLNLTDTNRQCYRHRRCEIPIRRIWGNEQIWTLPRERERDDILLLPRGPYWRKIFVRCSRFAKNRRFDRSKHTSRTPKVFDGRSVQDMPVWKIYTAIDYVHWIRWIELIVFMRLNKRILFIISYWFADYFIYFHFDGLKDNGKLHECIRVHQWECSQVFLIFLSDYSCNINVKTFYF